MDHRGGLYRFSKRATDLLLGGVALLLAAPFMLLIAIAIKISSRGEILFIQPRSGLGGRPFRVVKFRTMARDTTVEVGKETAPGDPRITRVGGFLRRTGLDELPQLFNVLAGQMSLVGPRPLLQWENDRCDQRQRRRLLVKPGITGLSQVSGRNNISWSQRIEWDLDYVDRASLWLDMIIMLKTFNVVLFARDAYLTNPPSVSEVPSQGAERG